jgi:SulP family sulfate permease
MAELTDVKLDTGTMQKFELPDGVRLYEVAGPLFFGAAGRAMSVLESIGNDGSLAVILYLGQVPAIDATGLVAMESVLRKLKGAGHKVILAGMRKGVSDVLQRAGMMREPGRLAFAPDLDSALSMAIVHNARQRIATPLSVASSPPPA